MQHISTECVTLREDDMTENGGRAEGKGSCGRHVMPLWLSASVPRDECRWGIAWHPQRMQQSKRERKKGQAKGREGEKEGKKTRAGPDQTQAGEAEKRRRGKRCGAKRYVRTRRNARACTHETATGEDKPIDRKNETWRRRGRRRRDEERKDGGRYVIADAQVSE
ncbi:hypothetical protein WR25_10095 [Diploscapter pachys]|uniref:Uncharacterized protein n=1 Tax=Diploscapter pachys TaxID=2018661 RepID=A0A2A2JIM9_9BILA|nr:hypothetical protein WR25_10095 [Diploscapter pachys]